MKDKGQDKTNSNSLSNKALNGVFWMTSGVGSQQALQLLILAVLARLLTPEDFGMITAAMVVLSISNLFVEIGFGPAIIQREELNGLHIQSAYTLSAILGLIFFGLMQVFAPQIEIMFDIAGLEQVVRVMSIAFIWQGFGVVSEGVLSRTFRFKNLAFIRITSYFIGYGIIAVIMALIGFGHWSLVAAAITQSMINAILLVISVKHNLRFKLHKQSVKDMLFLGGGFSLSRIINYFALQGDKLIVGRYLGAEQLGIYGKAYELMVFPTKLYDQIVSKVALSSLSKIQHEPERMAKAFRKAMNLTALLGLPMTVFITILGPDIILLLFGDQWTGMIEPFYLLAVGIFFKLAYRVSSSVILAKGYVYVFALTQLLYAILVILGTYFSVPYGLVGVCSAILIATIINYLFLTIIALYFTRLRVGEFLRAHFTGFVFASLLTFSTGATTILLPEGYSVMVIILSMLFLIVIAFLGLCISSKIFWGEDGFWFREQVREKLFQIKDKL